MLIGQASLLKEIKELRVLIDKQKTKVLIDGKEAEGVLFITDKFVQNMNVEIHDAPPEAPENYLVLKETGFITSEFMPIKTVHTNNIDGLAAFGYMIDEETALIVQKI